MHCVIIRTSKTTKGNNMMYLLQILRMLNKTQRSQFVELFSDLDYELNDMGWAGNETDLINDMLFNHFGLTVEDDRQLKMLTDSILKKGNLQAALTVANLH
jgi:hypothetical protein